jgi:hypothetical protein
MRKTVCACLFLSICMAHTCANAQQQKKSSVVTYYPAPRADYKTVRLDPIDQPAISDSRPGQMYYNASSQDKIMYYNQAGIWVPLGSGAATSPTDHLPPKDEFGGTCSTGDAYYDNATDVILYLNKTRNWTPLAPDKYWAESALIPASGPDLDHYNVYLINSTLRRVGIGTATPTCPLDVRMNDTPDALYEATRPLYLGGFYADKATDQWFSFHLFPNGTQIHPSALDSTSEMYASANPAENMKFAALDASGSISFNVGGYSSPNSELMRLVNPGGAGNPSPRVGIENATPPFALFIDSNRTTSVFAARSVQPGYNDKTGYWNLIPYSNRLYLAYGIIETLDDKWWRDPYYSNKHGGPITEGGKIGITVGSGLRRWDYDINSYNKTTNLNYIDNWEDENDTLFTVNGAYEGASSRTKKENFIPLNQDEILHKIGQLKVTRWNFKTEGPSVKHIGPVAEDFYQLFKTGESENELPPMDSAGVSLAGVKALSAKLNAQQQQIERLEAAIKDMKSQLGLRRGGLR